MAYELAHTYPDFLFILLNYQANPIQFKINEQANLKVFVNNHDIASLTHITKNLDLLISIDTGNVHLADILQIPSLCFIRSVVAYRMSGGSYGGVYKQVVVKLGWQKHYQKHFQNFISKSKELLSSLSDVKI